MTRVRGLPAGWSYSRRHKRCSRVVQSDWGDVTVATIERGGWRVLVIRRGRSDLLWKHGSVRSAFADVAFMLDREVIPDAAASMRQVPLPMDPDALREAAERTARYLGARVGLNGRLLFRDDPLPRLPRCGSCGVVGCCIPCGDCQFARVP